MSEIYIRTIEQHGSSDERRDYLSDSGASQLSFFNEVEANCQEDAPEPIIEETLCQQLKQVRKPKKKGKREEDLKDFPQKEILHDVSNEKLNRTFGEGNYKNLPDEIFWQLRFENARP